MSKRKKERVAFRKNMAKRTRANDMTGAYGDASREDRIGASSERVRAKGALSRHRTIITEDASAENPTADGDALSRMAVDLSECEPGQVIRIHGLNSVVEASQNGRMVRCQIRRVLKSLAIDERSIIAVGDRVWFRPHGQDEGFIEKVEPRKSLITRGYRHREHVIAANIDQLLIVSAFADPGLKPALIDRYLISAERGDAKAVIVLNKSDLVDLANYQWVIGLYSQLGYEVLPTSVKDGRGLDRLRQILSQGATAFSGQSGVGKSSLLNAIQPGLNLRVNEISEHTSKGRHTTTHAELIKLGLGGYVVDTPGLRQFEIWGIELGELEGHFIEFRPFIPNCRFPDCTHTHEHDCAVKDAADWGWIDQGRYESYLKLFFQQPLEDKTL